MSLQYIERPVGDVGAVPAEPIGDLIRGWAGVCAEVRRSRVQLWRDIRAGRFPAPLQIGENSIAWIRTEVDDWKSSRPRRTYGRVSATPEADDHMSPAAPIGAFAGLDAFGDADPQARRRERPRRGADAAE